MKKKLESFEWLSQQIKKVEYENLTSLHNLGTHLALKGAYQEQEKSLLHCD